MTTILPAESSDLLKFRDSHDKPQVCDGPGESGGVKAAMKRVPSWSAHTSKVAAINRDLPIQRVVPKTFIDLPFVIKEMIYLLLLRPDAICYASCTGWNNALGCTKVFGLSKGIRAEAIGVLECLVSTLDFQGHGCQVFRHMKAHGTPGFFRSYSLKTSCDIPPPLTVLAFLRLRKITINLRYPVKRNVTDNVRAFFEDSRPEILDGLQKEFGELRTAVAKSKSLVELHLSIQSASFITDRQKENDLGPSTCQPITSADNRDLVDLLAPLIILAGENRFRITALEDNNFFCPNLKTTVRAVNYQDPLVSFINEAAIHGHLGSRPQPELPGSVTVKPQCSYPFEEAEDESPALLGRQAYQKSDYPQMEYELLPECRLCYETFRERAELDAHLQRYPKHKVAFVKKRYNQIDKGRASHPPEKHKCSVCARPFFSLANFEKHQDGERHGRDPAWGIVPRWSNDNRWWGKNRGHPRRS